MPSYYEKSAYKYFVLGVKESAGEAGELLKQIGRGVGMVGGAIWDGVLDAADWTAPHVAGALGMIIEPPDIGNWQMSSVSQYLPTDLPDTLDLSGFIPPPKDQGSAGTCTAHAMSAVLECHANRLRGIKYKLSPQFHYDLRDDATVAGMAPANMLNIAVAFGMAPEEVYPYEDRDDMKRPCVSAAKAAECFKIGAFWEVRTVTQAKQALVEFGPLTIGVPVFKSAYLSRSTTMWRSTSGETEFIGHMMCVVGYTQAGFVIRNSWGKRWNRNGHVVMPFADFTELAEGPLYKAGGFACFAMTSGSVGVPDPLAGAPAKTFACGVGSATVEPVYKKVGVTSTPAYKVAEKVPPLATPEIRMGTRATAASFKSIKYKSSRGIDDVVSLCAEECRKVNRGGGQCGLASVHNPKRGQSECKLSGMGDWISMTDGGDRWATVDFRPPDARRGPKT